MRRTANKKRKNEFINLTVTKVKNKLYIQVTNSKSQLEKFEVVRFEKAKLANNTFAEVIVLNRVKHKPI